VTQGKGYNENFFDSFRTLDSSNYKYWNTRLYGTDGTDITAIAINPDYSSLLVSNPGDAYTLAYTGTQLDTVTRTSDSKVITLTYTGDNLTGVSDWT